MPPLGIGFWFENLAAWSDDFFCCMLTICCSDVRADFISGLNSFSDVLPTASSTNSLASTVWAVRDEVPSKAEPGLSSPSS